MNKNVTLSRIIFKLAVFSVIIIICIINSGCIDSSKNLLTKQVLLTTESEPSKWQGVWVMSEYVDTIISNKKVAKYHKEIPENYSLICFLIQGDSLFAKGSIWSVKTNIFLDKDTIATIDTRIYGRSPAHIIKSGNHLTVRFENTLQKTNNYESLTYYKRKEYQHFLDRDFKESFSNYIESKIFVNSYLDKDNREIKFLANGVIVGLNTYTKYKIDPYFGTLHGFLGEDMVTLFTQNKEQHFYNFKFRNNELLLTKFTHPTKQQYIENRRKGIVGDYFVLGDTTKRMILNIKEK